MIAWIDDLEKVTLDNSSFRTVVYAGEHAHTPPDHPDGTGHVTKADADATKHDHE
jgi:hypothetical protein